jgi:transcriptional regulator GlxA family with amidase domain
MTHHLAFLIFPDFQLLDATGPIAAFEIASRYQPGAYELRIIAPTAGPVASSSGVTLQARGLGRADLIDTLIVAGGEGSRAAMYCARIQGLVRACAMTSRRVVSVCSGTYILAAAGLLDGKVATTHWSRSADFARKFPAVRLDADRIFVKAGKLWTSAGITAGIDLALALIGEDLGESTARRTAQQLVVYHRRPGGQSQFSALLDLGSAQGRFAPLLDFIRENLSQPLGVEALAARACMSPRHFARAFRAETGVTPAKVVERLRVDAARAALESGGRSVKDVARFCGFEDTERMRRAFHRMFGTSPSALKLKRRLSPIRVHAE